MNSLARTLATPLSPVMVSITNNAPAVRPSGAMEGSPSFNPYANPDGSTNTSAVVWTGVSVVSAFASAYHGAMRNKGSVGYGFLWGVAGALSPIVTPAIAVAQGFAKPESR